MRNGFLAFKWNQFKGCRIEGKRGVYIIPWEIASSEIWFKNVQEHKKAFVMRVLLFKYA